MEEKSLLHKSIKEKHPELSECIDTLNQYEIKLVCKTLQTLYAEHSLYPFTTPHTIEDEWDRKDILYYIQLLETSKDEYGLSNTIEMTVMAIITTVIVQRGLLA